jgi:hypothetical protein
MKPPDRQWSVRRGDPGPPGLFLGQLAAHPRGASFHEGVVRFVRRQPSARNSQRSSANIRRPRTKRFECRSWFSGELLAQEHNGARDLVRPFVGAFE